MRGYHKLDLNKLNYTDKPISYEDVLVNVTHLNIPIEICSGEQKMKVISTEVDCGNKRILLAINKDNVHRTMLQ